MQRQRFERRLRRERGYIWEVFELSFSVFADGSANLPQKLLDGISLLPCEYTVDGVSQVYTGDLEHFDAHAYYDRLRSGTLVQTSLLNTHLFLSHFTPVLEQGRDLICVCMSSGISGTFQAALNAARELMGRYKERFVHIVDSLGCGFGNGLLAVRAAELSRQGANAREAAAILDEEVPHICQYFTVDDLAYLKRTGRVSGIAARLGAVLNIRPILYGDRDGRIVACGKVRGRARAVEFLAKKYEEKRLQTGEQTVCISHGDCPEDAQKLAELVRAITPGVPVTICPHEPFSGAHVGPGMLGLFFRGTER